MQADGEVMGRIVGAADVAIEGIGGDEAGLLHAMSEPDEISQVSPDCGLEDGRLLSVDAVPIHGGGLYCPWSGMGNQEGRLVGY